VYLEIELTIELTNCCHLEVKGFMFSSDDKFLATGEEIRDNDYDLSSSDFLQISSCDVKVTNNNSESQHFNTILKFPVNKNSETMSHLVKAELDDLSSLEKAVNGIDSIFLMGTPY
jgi:hypothetical protein